MWEVVNASGVIGRVVVLWDNRELELVGMEMDLFFIFCLFKNFEEVVVWTCVYASNKKCDKENC